MYAVKLVQVVSTVEVVPEICEVYIFLGAQRFQSIVGAEGLVVESVRFIYPRKDARHYVVVWLFLVLLNQFLVLFHQLFRSISLHVFVPL